MQFNELEIDALFTFHSFSKEVWQKISATQCVCVSYENEEIYNDPCDVKQRVFRYVPQVQRGQVDKFQPLALISALRQKIKEVRDNERLESVQKAHMVLGLAWAICETQKQATAKDRYTSTEDTGYPGIDKATERHLMEYNG